MLDQAKILSDSGHEVTIIALSGRLSPPENVEVRLLMRPFGFYIDRMRYLTVPFDPISVARNIRYLARFDLLIAHYYPMTWLSELTRRVRGSKYILYNHGILDTTTQDKRLIEKAYVRLLSLLYASTIGKPDAIVSISEYTRLQLRNQTGLESRVIPNPIDTKRFNPEIDSGRVRTKHNLGTAPVLLFVGLIEPRKGIHMLVQVHKAVRKKFPDAKLLIVGRTRYSKYLEFLRGMIDESVMLIGWVDEEELPYYFAACDTYVTASSWEGFDLPIAEAQASGKPVVAFDIGSHGEIVKQGVGGYLVRFGDTDEFTRSVIDLLSNEAMRHEMGTKGRAFISRRYGTENFTRGLQCVVESVARKR